MSLIARGGSLLVGSDGNLTTNEDCCCDPECSCEIPRSPPTACQCMDGAFGVYRTLGLATITISGTATAYDYDDPDVGGRLAICDGVCASIAGSYVIPCGTVNKTFCRTAFVCTVGSNDVYYLTFFTLGYLATSVQIIIYSYALKIPTGSDNPYPEVTECDTSLGQPDTSNVTHSWFETPLADDYVFLLEGACTAECNIINPRRSCVTPGTKTMTNRGEGNAGWSSCKVSDYTVSLSIGSPS